MSEPTITLPLSALQSIIFGDDELFAKPLFSPGIGDHMFKVVKVVWSIGNLIKELDPQENYFHVKLFPEVVTPLTPPSHAELWTPFDWSESNARRERGRQHSAQRVAEFTLDQQFTADLVDLLTTKFPESFCRELAETIKRHYMQNNFTELFNAIDLEELPELINDYKRRKNAETTQ